MFEHLLKSYRLTLKLYFRSFGMFIFSGPLPPSRRRSLFTLAASMVLFSAKAFNLFPLADFTKVALQGPMVR